MALRTSPVQNIVLADLVERWFAGDFEQLFWGPQDATGAIVFCRQAGGGFIAYRVTDAFFSVVRRGSATVTIGAVAGNGTVNVALSPPLAGAIADYLPFMTLGATTGQVGLADVPSGGSAQLLNLSTLQLECIRGPANVPLSADTTTVGGSAAHTTHLGHTPGTHSSIDVNVTNPHTHDAHTLTHSAHSVHDHTHAWPGTIAVTTDWTNLVQVNTGVNWLILRA